MSSVKIVETSVGESLREFFCNVIPSKELLDINKLKAPVRFLLMVNKITEGTYLKICSDSAQYEPTKFNEDGSVEYTPLNKKRITLLSKEPKPFIMNPLEYGRVVLNALVSDPILKNYTGNDDIETLFSYLDTLEYPIWYMNDYEYITRNCLGPIMVGNHILYCKQSPDHPFETDLFLKDISKDAKSWIETPETQVIVEGYSVGKGEVVDIKGIPYVHYRFDKKREEDETFELTPFAVKNMLSGSHDYLRVNLSDGTKTLMKNTELIVGEYPENTAIVCDGKVVSIYDTTKVICDYDPRCDYSLTSRGILKVPDYDADYTLSMAGDPVHYDMNGKEISMEESIPDICKYYWERFYSRNIDMPHTPADVVFQDTFYKAPTMTSIDLVGTVIDMGLGKQEKLKTETVRAFGQIFGYIEREFSIGHAVDCSKYFIKLMEIMIEYQNINYPSGFDSDFAKYVMSYDKVIFETSSLE